jgi:hypothetical protein
MSRHHSRQQTRHFARKSVRFSVGPAEDREDIPQSDDVQIQVRILETSHTLDRKAVQHGRQIAESVSTELCNTVQTYS